MEVSFCYPVWVSKVKIFNPCQTSDCSSVCPRSNSGFLPALCQCMQHRLLDASWCVNSRTTLFQEHFWSYPHNMFLPNADAKTLPLPKWNLNPFSSWSVEHCVAKVDTEEIKTPGASGSSWYSNRLFLREAEFSQLRQPHFQHTLLVLPHDAASFRTIRICSPRGDWVGGLMGVQS